MVLGSRRELEFFIPGLEERILRGIGSFESRTDKQIRDVRNGGIAIVRASKVSSWMSRSISPIDRNCR